MGNGVEIKRLDMNAQELRSPSGKGSEVQAAK